MTIRLLQTWVRGIRVTTIMHGPQYIRGILKVAHNGSLYLVYYNRDKVCEGRLMFMKTLKDWRGTVLADWSEPIEIKDGDMSSDDIEVQQPGLTVTPSGVLYVTYMARDWELEEDWIFVFRSLDEGDNWGKVSENRV